MHTCLWWRDHRVSTLGSFVLCHYKPSSLVALVTRFSLPSTHMPLSSVGSFAQTRCIHAISSFFFTLLVVFPLYAFLYEGKITACEALSYLRFSQLHSFGMCRQHIVPGPDADE
ncbi:hypothetical protein PVAP13_4KG222705 [Panicum virgatum]|uniref:Uncharacterized protein n=1 Tax=Panicum virgatum TaxID=38727 RepID=A0A8T0TPJ7_PANVG|nr:hypothetical protein PVAP13_4KG222705 [Panicum virgatum]